ncbi:hypothetical protein [Paracoccus sp. ME4]|uniref:hypothetical protein n=1 Tax=Paracoccus sp. ME4 TaxID=3138066 RepID=UPI00398B8D18
MLLATTAFGAMPAAAQGMPEGEFVRLGEVAGLNVFKVEGQDGLWLISPDNKTVINGDYYDMSGPAPMVNYEPLDPSEQAAPPAAAGLAPPTALAPGIGMSQPAIAIPELDTPAVAAPAAPHASQVAGVEMIDGIFNRLEAQLTGVDATVRNDLLVNLVNRMESARSPEEFQLMLMEWQAMVAGNAEVQVQAREGLDAIASGSVPAEPVSPASDLPEPLPAPRPVQNLPEVTSQDMGSPLVPVPPSAAEPVGPATAAPAGPLDASISSAPAEPQDDSVMLLSQIRSDGHWFSVGRIGAPTVYAIIDPTCLHCARAVANLAPEIEAGQLDMRVLLAPVVSKAAPGKIAAILLSDDPAQSFLDHEKGYAANGASSLADRDFAELSPEMNEAIRINREIVIENGLPGVPFFAYVTAEGIKFSSGVPDAGKFSGAEPDPMSAN